MLRLLVIRTEENIPESLQDDVNQLKAALELCGMISDYNKVVKDLNKALDEKCRARYDSLTHEEILELLVNKKWFDSNGNLLVYQNCQWNHERKGIERG